MAHHRRLGWALVVTSLLVSMAGVAIVFYLGVVEILAWLADPDVLLAVVGANWLVALVRLASTEHAWRTRGGRHPMAALLLAILVIAPHTVLSWVGLETREALGRVFVVSEAPSGVTPPPSPAPSTTSPATATTEGVILTTTTTPPTTAPPQREPTEMTVPETLSTLPFDGERRNLLLLGGDAGPGREGLRTDTVIVASIDPRSGHVALFGIPRNFGGLVFSDGTPYPGGILNTVYGWGKSHPGAFGGVDPGASATRDVVEHMTGLHIHHFVLVDLTGFAAVIDALGGVTITVPAPVYGPLYDPGTGTYEMIEIPAGEQELTGGEALAYSRARYGSSDYARMARQRCVLAALVTQSDALALVWGLGDVLEVIQTQVTTDLPLDDIPDLIRVLPLVQAAETSVIGFDQTWSAGRTPEGHAIPDVERIRAFISETLRDPSAANDLGGETAAEACG